jgi:[ribosomal protein S5]-alanine N-acetyltransferase
MIIQTPRLTLRPYKLDDIEAYSELNSDPRLLTYELHEPYDFEMSKQVLLYWIDAYQKTDGAFGFSEMAVTLTDSEQLIGLITFTFRDIKQQVLELGFRFMYDFQNKGYCTEALHAVMQHAFTQHSIHKIFCCSDAENKSALRVFEKLKMEKEATLKMHILMPNGFYIDEVVYAIFRN